MVLNRLVTTLDSSKTDNLIGLIIDLDNSLVATRDKIKITAKDTNMTKSKVSLYSVKKELNKYGLNRYMRVNKAARGKNATAINQDKNLR